MPLAIHALHVTSRPSLSLRGGHIGASAVGLGLLVCAAPFTDSLTRSVFGVSATFLAQCRLLPSDSRLARHIKSIGSARARHAVKVRMCNCVDPYTLRPGAGTSADFNALSIRDARWYRQLSRLLLERRDPAENKRSNASRNLQKKRLISFHATFVL